MPNIPDGPVTLTRSGPAPRQSEPRSVRFLLRLHLALGAALPAVTSCTGDKVDSGGGDSTPETGHHCDDTSTTQTVSETLSTLDDGTCDPAPDPTVFEQYELNHQVNCRDVVLTASSETLCTYDVTCDFYTCCYGRPYLDARGKALLTGAVRREDWKNPVGVDLRGLDAEDRAQLVAFWLHNAAAEHSSVAGFHRFALDLLAHGAPPALVAAAQRAAAQELGHALACYSLASAYAGEGFGPGPMALGQSAPVARDLVELAVWALRDGAIGETIAAYGVAASLEQTRDPEVRRLLTAIADEELEHAELAWQTVAWAMAAGGVEVTRAVRAVFNQLTVTPEAAERCTPGTVAHGILPVEARNAATAACVGEVLRPVFASLLATRLAA